MTCGVARCGALGSVEHDAADLLSRSVVVTVAASGCEFPGLFMLVPES